MGVSGWYGVWYENCHIITYLSYIVSFWQVRLFDIVCGVKGKTAECSECVDMGMFARVKKPYHTRDLVIWVFARAKKPYHPCDPLSHLLRSTRVIYVLESHVSITYAKWKYFLVNVWYSGTIYIYIVSLLSRATNMLVSLHCIWRTERLAFPT